MKKHIFGLAIFSFIVVASAFVYGVFNVSEMKTAYKIGIRKIAKDNGVEIKQAVFDVKTKEFNWQLYVPENSGQIDLHFFTKDGQGTHYLTTEQVSYASVSLELFNFSDSYDWLKNLKSFENLYVIAQNASESKNYSENVQVDSNKFQPKFDSAKAIPVTIDYGK